jgi:hypothetical protein
MTETTVPIFGFFVGWRGISECLQSLQKDPDGDSKKSYPTVVKGFSDYDRAFWNQ